MRPPRYAIGALATLLTVVALFVIYVRSPLRPWLRVRSLERQVKSNIDPIELQQWATNLLAQHSDGLRLYEDFDGTNLPSGLKRVKGFGQAVTIIPHGPGKEPDVCVFCGGPKGEPFLVVGPPSLGTPKSPSLIPWQPGIYFVYSPGWH
jgi:hypothetical protein